MEKFIFMGAIGLFLLGSCNSKPDEEHNHETGEHAHAEYDHESHDHESKNRGHEYERAGHEHEHAAGAAVDHSGETILPPAKVQAADVETSIVEPGTSSQVIKTSGRVMAVQGDESITVVTVVSVISFHGEVIGGMSINKDISLVMLSSKNITSGDPVRRVRIAYKTTKKEYERIKELLPNKIVSEKDFVQTRQTYENARISYEAVVQNYSAQGQVTPSPISGYIKGLLTKEGDYITVSQPLVGVAQNRKLFLRADVSERYYPYLCTIGSVSFCTPYNNKVYTLEELNGRLLSYRRASGENSYYVPVTFELNNKGDIIPGSFVEIFLLPSPMENVILLPHTVLTEEQGSFFVYLQIDEEGYKKQPVILGADNGEKVQILPGVKAGDRVMTQGAYQVKPTGVTNAIPAYNHGH